MIDDVLDLTAELTPDAIIPGAWDDGADDEPRRVRPRPRREPTTRWGCWDLDPERPVLVNRAAGAELDLTTLRDCRSLWRLTCNAALRAGADGLEPLNVLRALATVLPPAALCAKPGLLRASDVQGLCEAARLGVLRPWPRAQWWTINLHQTEMEDET